MIRLDTWSDLLATPGRYATAYLDASRAKELGPQEVDDRWRALRSELASQGADEATLDAMQAAVGGHTDVSGAHAQLLVASGGTLRMDGVLPGPPRRETARVAPLPHLMPMVAQLGPTVPHVLVLVDRVGADVTVHGPEARPVQTVEGDDSEVHKTAVGGWAQKRYQHRAENLGRPTRGRSPRSSSPAYGGWARRWSCSPATSGPGRTWWTRSASTPARSSCSSTTGAGPRGSTRRSCTAAVEEAVARVAADRDQAVIDRYAEAAGRAGPGSATCSPRPGPPTSSPRCGRPRWRRC